MALSPETKIEGLDGILEVFHKLPLEVEKKVMKGALKEGATTLQQAMVTRAPVGLTGRLAESIKTTARGLAKRGVFGFNVAVGVFYSRFLEFGTSKMSAKPFVRPAYDESQAEIIKNFAAKMKAGVEREAKKLAKKK